MIVDCPHCHTSNSESDTGPDGTVLCRSCQRRFKAGEQAFDAGSNTTQVARSALEGHAEGDLAHLGTTPEMTIPHVEHDVEGDTDNPTRVGVSPVLGMNDVEATNHEGPTRIGNAPANPHDERTSVGVMPKEPLGENVEVKSNDHTNIMSQQDLYRNLIESHAIEHGDTVSGIKIPPLPAEPSATEIHHHPEPVQTPGARPWAQEVRKRGLAAYHQFMEQPKPVRVASSVAAGLLVLLVILSVRLATRSSTTVAFISEGQPLLSAPVDGARPNGASGGLRRGEQVTVLDHKGDFVVVSDLQGHVGYVQESGLLQERPASSPDTAFVDCRPAVLEEDVQGCKDRAEAQWESCLSVCEKHDQLSKCNDDCRGQYRVCMAACNGEPVHPEPGYPSTAMPSDAPQGRDPTQVAPLPPPRPESSRSESHKSVVKSTKKSTDKKHKH